MTYPIGMERRYGYVLPLATEQLQSATGNEISFSAPTYIVEEGGTAAVVVTKTGAGAVTVDYATADGTAIAGDDYTAATGTLTWAEGDTTPRTINVATVGDVVEEGAEYLTMTLSNAVGATLGAVVLASIVIVEAGAAVDYCAGALLCDRFNGAAGTSLLDHTPDVGLAYRGANGNFDPVDPVPFILTGDGAARRPGINFGEEPAGGASFGNLTPIPLDAVVTVEFDVTILPGDADYNAYGLYASYLESGDPAQPAPDDVLAELEYSPTLLAVGGPTGPHLRATTSSDTGTGQTDFIPATVGATYRVRAVIDPVGDIALTVYALDGNTETLLGSAVGVGAGVRWAASAGFVSGVAFDTSGITVLRVEQQRVLAEDGAGGGGGGGGGGPGDGGALTPPLISLQTDPNESYLFDTFTPQVEGENITAHVPEIGGAWFYTDGGNNDYFEVRNGRLRIRPGSLANFGAPDENRIINLTGFPAFGATLEVQMSHIGYSSLTAAGSRMLFADSQTPGSINRYINDTLGNPGYLVPNYRPLLNFEKFSTTLIALRFMGFNPGNQVKTWNLTTWPEGVVKTFQLAFNDTGIVIREEGAQIFSLDYGALIDGIPLRPLFIWPLQILQQLSGETPTLAEPIWRCERVRIRNNISNN